MGFREQLKQKYKDILMNYLGNPSEETLYLAEKFSRELLEKKIDPEEIVNVHKMLLTEIIPSVQKDVVTSFDVLLEIMMGYGFAYREHQSLRYKQMELKMELEIGANIQKTMLGTELPDYDFLDIGVISVPAKVMNGDYYHFVKHKHDHLMVAIADIAGKGIPAALCMSLIKFAIESNSYSNDQSPEKVMENLNRTIEKNLNPGMFITMMYGSYSPLEHLFEYASAGHEPGLYYNQKEENFTELETKGLMLGIDPNVTYQKFTKKLEAGDMIILLSDGVTETRTATDFLSKEEITKLIRKFLHLSSQEIVENIYKELKRNQQYDITDDFTMLILKRKV